MNRLQEEMQRIRRKHRTRFATVRSDSPHSNGQGRKKGKSERGTVSVGGPAAQTTDLARLAPCRAEIEELQENPDWPRPSYLSLSTSVELGERNPRCCIGWSIC